MKINISAPIATLAACVVVVGVSSSAFAACQLPSGATAGSCSYSGTGAALKITDTNGSGTPYAIAGAASGKNGRAIYGNATGLGGYGGVFQSTAPTSNANNAAIWAGNSGGSTSTGGDYGSAGVFQINNAMNQSPAISVNTNGVGSSALSVTQSAVGPAASENGSAGVFTITNVNNRSPALTGTNNEGDGVAGYSTSANGVYGSADNGFGVYGTSTLIYGVYGQTTGTNAESVGVYGYSSSGMSGAFTNGSGGSNTCSYDGGATWSCVNPSDAMNERAAPNYAALLDKLDAMPVNYYRLTAAKVSERYLGPSAEDFKAAFGLGKDDKSIRDGNAYGVALAAAKGLYRKLKADEATIAAQSNEIAALKRQVAEQQAAAANFAALADQVKLLRAEVGRLSASPALRKEVRADGGAL